MNPNQLNDLDAFIEEALKSEPMRPVPTGFHKRVDSRLHVAAIVREERHRLRMRMVATTLILATAAFVIVGAPLFAFYQGWMVQQVPGGRGYADYVLLSVNQVWQALGLKGLVACGLGLTAMGIAAAAPMFSASPSKSR